jgi:hypothetical protein
VKIMGKRDKWINLEEVPDSADIVYSIVNVLEDEGYTCKVLEGKELEEFLRKEVELTPEEIDEWVFGYTVCTKGDKRVIIVWRA